MHLTIYNLHFYGSAWSGQADVEGIPFRVSPWWWWGALGCCSF